MNPPTDESAQLHELASLYDQAFGALQEGAVDRVQSLVARADELIQTLPPHRADHGPTAELREGVQARHARLMAAMRDARAALSDEIGRVRKGKKSLGAYGKRASTIGNRIQRDA